MKLIILDRGASRELDVSSPQLLSTLFSLHKVPLAMPCGGRRRCKKCRVKVSGTVSALTSEERAALSAQELADGVRFACMTTLLGDATVTLPEHNDEKILTDGALPAFTLQPLGKQLGIAVDIGTTTLAAYLYDLRSGGLLATASAVNPQARFGADVISRLQKSHEGQRAELAHAIRAGLNGLFDALSKRAGKPLAEVDAVVLTGNTAMQYLLTGQAPDAIIRLPFLQDRDFGEYLPPAALDLALPGCERVYLTRCISAYVGGDITMSSMAAELFRRDASAAPRLLCDIGTNGEMVLCADGKFWCCSTAAGPTFEGAGIAMGMTARQGAVSKVFLQEGQFICQVIGGGKATGICGSGIIDAVAAMLRVGVVDETGYLCEDGHDFAEFVCEAGGQNAFRLPGTEVVIRQADVRAVQLAKAAICAGMLTLLHTAGLDGAVIPLKIAGGFGSFIDVTAAERIGLIPQGFAAASEAIGNAAGAGACMVLLSGEMLRRSEDFSRCVQTVELSSDKFFMQAYTDEMMFPEA